MPTGTPLRRVLALTVIAVTAALGLTASPASAYPDRAGAVGVDGACEGELLKLHNAARTQAGLPKLVEDPAFDHVARAWAERLATTRALAHNPNYSKQVAATLPSWYTLGENVGNGPSAAYLHTAYMNSPGHRANILSTKFQRIAIGCYRDAKGLVWTTVNFAGSFNTIGSPSVAPFHSAGDAVSRLRWWALGTSPNNMEIEADVARLLKGQTTVQGYAASLVNTAAHKRIVPSVTRLYSAVFLREPDAGGLTYWMRMNQGGLGLDTTATLFADSPEFQNRYGKLTNRAYVDLVYRNVLQRTPDAGGINYWTDMVNKGMTRGRMLIGFSDSPEYIEKTDIEVSISWAHIQLLDRIPTAAERTAWTAKLKSGATVDSLIESIVASPEFTVRAAAHTY